MGLGRVLSLAVALLVFLAAAAGAGAARDTPSFQLKNARTGETFEVGTAAKAKSLGRQLHRQRFTQRGRPVPVFTKNPSDTILSRNEKKRLLGKFQTSP